MSSLQVAFKRSSSWRSLSEKLPLFAKKSSLVQRVRRDFSPEKFLLAFIGAVISGKASLNEIAMDLEGPNASQTNSTQALQQRITRTETGVESFLLFCLFHVLNVRLDDSQASDASTSKLFGRILTEDSSFLRLPKKNAEEFPAHGNAHGNTAGAKSDLIFDLLTGEPIHADLYLGTEQDKLIGDDIFAYLMEGDLVLRDMGYFKVELFQEIEQHGADWLSRLPLTVDASATVTTAQGEEIVRELEELLKHTSQDRLDLTVSLSAKGHQCRLIAVRASEQEAQKRRRDRRTRAKEKGKTANQKALIRDGWHLMVTSVKKGKQSLEALCAIYRQRWQIEIIFRAWKQSSQLQSALNRVSSVQHLKGLMLSGILLMAISLKMGLRLVRLNPDKRISLEKVFTWLSKKISQLQHFKDLATLDPEPVIRQLQRQSRRRKSLSENLIELLS